MKNFLYIVLLSVLPSITFAQPTSQGGVLQFPGCAAGSVPGQPGCGGVPDDDEFSPSMRQRSPSAARQVPESGSGALRYETGVWEESFGAFADDGKGLKGNGGRSEDSSSAMAARNEALRDCGHEDCKIRIEVRNGCWGVAYGKRSTYYYRTIADMNAHDPKKLGLQTVERGAMNLCKSAGDVDCSVRNTSCSLPSY
ncbi:DUF4189 domain-containing protein [Burkholderia territorii]|uniref:DUF4189 domain-containing protein n=1 Tax=Burkholderia territorii TaxID=1503055 RepID=UPI0009BEB5E6|nr:DUF4189 domain-containing protein [Burkholderia territorii]